MNIKKVQAIAFYTLLRNEVIRFMRIWPQSLLPSAITTALYFLIFGSFVGSRIGLTQGVPYMDFIMPGLVMMAIINNSYSNVVSSFYSSRFIKCVDELLIAPVPNWIILCGYVAGGVIRGVFIGIIVIGVSLFFTKLSVHNITLTCTIMLLTAIIFALAGFTNGIFARKFDDVSIIPTFVLTPLTYLGGVFFSINQLPAFWKNVALANPILYMVNSFRHGILGITDVHADYDLIIITVLIIALFALNVYLLRKGIGIKN
jgi:ABC-2 type transport system permease protein